MLYRHLVLTLAICSSNFVSIAAAEEAHTNTEVEWVLGYEIPAHDCKKPKLRQSNQNADQISRFQRQSKRYARCVAEYQTGIIEDHQRIIAAAEHGISKDQTQIFVEKLRNIEATVVELGGSAGSSIDPLEAERLLSVGNRSSI